MKQAACTTTTDEALQALRDAGLRLTQPRRQIIAALVAAETPLSPRELHEQLGSAACDPVTVYRCLTDFERLGLVHRHEFGDGSTRYQLVEADGSHLHYVICRHCQRKDPIHACPADLEATVRERGYAGVSHTLEFFGICPECQRGSDQGAE